MTDAATDQTRDKRNTVAPFLSFGIFSQRNDFLLNPNVK
jgi:hypothetical protein